MIFPINHPFQSLIALLIFPKLPGLSIEVTTSKALGLLSEILPCFFATSYCPASDDWKITHGEQHREYQI